MNTEYYPLQGPDAGLLAEEELEAINAKDKNCNTVLENNVLFRATVDAIRARDKVLV